MEQLLLKHPDLEDIIKRTPHLKTYKIITEKGKLVEQWEKNKKGEWVDVTEREKLKEQIAAEQEEIERLSLVRLRKKKEVSV